QLWDPGARTLVRTGPALLTPRQRHTATLEADGTVGLWGGLGAHGAALSAGEAYDPERPGFTALADEPTSSADPPRLAASRPADGGGDGTGAPSSVEKPTVPPSQGASDGDDAWHWAGARRDGRPYSPWQALPPLRAPGGMTALAGQVLQLNGEPLPTVTLQIG